MPRAVRNADRVICVSRATARDAVGLLDVPYRKLRVIPNAIEPVFSTPPGPAAARAAVPALRRHARSRARTCLRCSRRSRSFAAPGRRVRLALVGADGWGDVRVGSTEGVVAFGRVDDTELRDLYAHAEALVLPSLWEGFGLPVAEALATGTGSSARTSRPCASSQARTRPTSIPRAPRRSPRASCRRSRSRGRRRAAARAGTTPPRRSSRSGASSCRERASARPGRRRHRRARAHGRRELHGQPAARAACGRAGALARLLAARPRRPAGGRAGVGAAAALDVASPYRRIPFAFPALARREGRRSPTSTTSPRRACRAPPS